MSTIAPELLRHHDAMRRLASRLVVADDVDDVVQETMIRALQHQPPGELGAWLGRVLRNVVRFHRRSDSRRRQRETVVARRDATSASLLATSGSGRPVDTLQELEAAEEVSRALRRLPEPYRSVLVQRYFVRRSLADIAREQGVRTDTVRQRHRRGLHMMRVALAKRRSDGTPALTRARLATIFTPWLSPADLAATHTVATGPAVGAYTTLLLSITTMKSKVALGIAAVVALAGISTYALWAPSPGAALTPADDPKAPATSAGLRASAADREPGVETARTRLVDPSDRPTDPTATGPGTDLRLIWDDDGSPVTAMQVFLTDYRRWTSESQPDHRANTGEDGVARFRGLSEGRYLVEGRFRTVGSGPTTVDVDPTAFDGEPIVIRILRGTTVSGRVVDPDGRGIAAASVLRAGWASPWSQEIGVTEADGTFEIDGLHGRISMGARAPGFVPSLMRSMNLDEKTRDTLDIVLQPAAAQLTVRVVDSTGAPVVGARAAVGIFGRQNQPRRSADGSHQYVMPTNATTDERGVAELGGLAPGTWSLQVRAQGFSSHSGKVDVPPARVAGQARTIEREVLLPDMIVIEGTIRDSDGLPLEDVYVAFGRHGHLAHAGTSTAADGSYRLSGAPAGNVGMHAQHKGLDRRETIRTLPGRTHRWDAGFDAQRKVHGSVTWQDGSPVPGAGLSVWSVGATPSWHTLDRTDDRGHFVLEMPQHVTSVRAQVGASGPFYQVVHEGPLPEGNLDIVLGPDHVQSATIRGRIVGPDGEPLPGANLWYGLVGQGNASPIAVDAEGRFEQDVTPGGYDLRIDVAGFARAREHVEVGTDEEKNLGDIGLAHPAAIRVIIDGAPDGDMDFWLTHADTDRRNRLEIVNGQGSIGGLPEGRYRLQVCGDQLASESHEVFLKATPGGGTPTEVRLIARPATPLAITVSVAGEEEPSNRPVDIEILDAAGQVVVRHRTSISAQTLGYTRFALAPGRYELRARSGDLSATTTVALSTVKAEPHEIALELRPGG